MAKVDKLVRFVEYIGSKESKKYYSALYNETVEFKPNDDFGGKKVAIVDVNIATEMLRFPTVFREIELRELAREKIKGGNQSDLLETKVDSDVADDPIEDAIEKDRKKIDKKAKGKR